MTWFKPEHPTQLFGQMLVKHNLITEEQLERAIEHQRQTGQRLGEIFAEWELVTHQHVQDMLRKQRRIRMAAAFISAVFAPLESYAMEAALPATAITQPAIVPRKDMQQLDDAQLDAISAQGLGDDLVNQVQKQLKDNGVVVLGDLAKLVNPVLGMLDSDVSMHNVVYAPNRATSMLNPDGSITLSLPTTIGELSFKNIRVHGATSGPSFGSITMKGIDLTGIVITLALKHGH
ncbi:hypothetical protein [Pseudoduganella sp. RAF53_2]|uniref:hypothetical protein n=1 Tax=unclassified Pseudoduganella TaxID=2637179 RepID=UPI003F983C47